MTLFGLQEISAAIAEFGDEEMKARVLPRFAHGEVTGAMLLFGQDTEHLLTILGRRWGRTQGRTLEERRLDSALQLIVNMPEYQLN